jgi:hypothetical protein
MARVSEIIKFVNDTWILRSFPDARFAGSAFYGMATYMPDGDLIKAVEINAKGLTIVDDLFYDNTKPMQIYHRMNTSRMIPSPKDGFGNEVGMLRQLDMSALVFIDKSRIGISGEDMEMVLYYGFPNSIPKNQLTTGFTSCRFQFNGCEHNQVYLFDREFKIKNFNLSPSVVLLEVKYLIECGYQKNCINILCCPD